MIKGDGDDPKGLILESYRIDGITISECRTIFLDWALSLPLGMDTGVAIRALLARYGADNLDHPMTSVLNDGLTSIATPQRRGGWRGRMRN